MTSTQNIISQREKNSLINIRQGDCVFIKDKEDIFQVIGVDDHHQRCWVRRWPLLAHGSPVFEISTQQILLTSSNK